MPRNPRPDRNIRMPGRGYVPPRPLPDHQLPPVEHRNPGHPQNGYPGLAGGMPAAVRAESWRVVRRALDPESGGHIRAVEETLTKSDGDRRQLSAPLVTPGGRSHRAAPWEDRPSLGYLWHAQRSGERPKTVGGFTSAAITSTFRVRCILSTDSVPWLEPKFFCSHPARVPI